MPAARAFAYHASLAPMLWVLIGLSVCELCLVHLLVALLWSAWVALGLTIVTLVGIAWLVATIRSFKRLPVVIDDERVAMRAGILKAIDVPRAAIAGLRGEISAADAKRRDVLKLSLLAHPNVVIDLIDPIDAGRGRMVRSIAHRLDDPAGFTAALAETAGA